MCRLQTIGSALRRRHAKRSPHHRLLLSPHDSGVRDFDCRFNLETFSGLLQSTLVKGATGGCKCALHYSAYDSFIHYNPPV